MTILVPRIALTVVLAGALLALAGCTSTAVKPRAFEVRLTVEKSLEATSLEVDLIGANALSDVPKWNSYSVTEYWQPNNPVRRDSPKATYQFGRGKASAVVFLQTDPRWKTWLTSGTSFLVIIADLPGAAADQAGNADPRRLVIPLDKKLWEGNAPLEVTIQESGVRLLTKQKKQN